MVQLGSAIAEAVVEEYGQRALLRRISDPFWFQALSCATGMDWHSSGTTSVTCGALKEGIDASQLGVGIAGGKGKASRRTPADIQILCDGFGIGSKADDLVKSSKLSAKVDSAALQDGHQLYIHNFFLTEGGDWCVIQQGMCEDSGFARRYHWLGESVTNFIETPHGSILGSKQETVLDMTAIASRGARGAAVDLINDGPQHFRHLTVAPSVESKKLALRREEPSGSSQMQCTLDEWNGGKGERGATTMLTMPRNINWNVLRGAYEFQPRNFEELLGLPGIGSGTVRALALISNLIYGTEVSWQDPVKYSFAVGGKDGVPYPIDKRAMDDSIDIIRKGIDQSRLGSKDRLRAIQRLEKYVPEDLR
jgi:hypothetical protein